ncbi:hypothetical protein BGX38DRAFT_1146402 [Terfezia claveryi]|nr:hypothetical protein BGX38DRAFT_1146402 [Terfezia claveryi]
MAPPLKGVIFRPVSDWGKGGYWATISGFGDKGAEARKGWKGEGDWYRYVSQLERDYREKEVALKVTDETSAERAIKILKRSIIFQDGVANGGLDSFDIEYVTTDKDGDLLERITVRPMKANIEREGNLDKSQYWVLTTPKQEDLRIEDVDEDEEELDLKTMKAGAIDWAEDEISELNVELNSRTPPMKGLKDSQHAIRSLTEEEVNEMIERLVES